MVSSMKYALTLAIIAAVACSAYGLKCFVCDSAYDVKCGEKFESQNHFAQDCANQAPPITAQFGQSVTNAFNGQNPFARANATGCMKRLYNQQNGQHRIQRHCFFGDLAHKDAGCRADFQAAGNQNFQLGAPNACDVCDNNLCNGSSAMGPIGFAIAIFFVLARVFS